MQSLRMKFGERRTDWRCCFCCHVRTGTILYGLYHFLINLLTLSALAVVMRYPEYFEGEMMDPAAPLPTPLSEIDADDFPKIHIEGGGSDFILSSRSQPPLPHSYRTVLPLNQREWNISAFFTMCTLGLIALLLFGAIKRKPSYLMPFFGFQVFNFCVTSMATIGYLCYPPNFSQLVHNNPYLPFREELLQLNPQTLSLAVVFTLMLSMMLKAYFIGVVWSCYKYLTLRQVAAQRLHFIDPDNQNLIRVQPTTDLPDYETAIKKFPTPPPSYATAVLGTGDCGASSSASATASAATPPAATMVIRSSNQEPALQGAAHQV